MSSPQLISKPSDQSSLNLSESGLPLSTPQPEPSPSSSLKPSISPVPPQSPSQILVPPSSPVKHQLPETLVDISVSECHQSFEVISETEVMQLTTSTITPDKQNTPMIIAKSKEIDLQEKESNESESMEIQTTTEASTVSKHEVDPEVDLQESKGELEVEEPLKDSLQPELQAEPVEEAIEETAEEATEESAEEPIPEPLPEHSRLKPIPEHMEVEEEFKPHFIPKPTHSPPPQIQAQASYHLKWVNLKGNKCPIVTQNENGPCPLIAIINVLLVKGRLQLPAMMEVITANQLIEYLGDCILENIPKGLKEEDQLNYEQNMHDAIAILPKLQTGLDVNVRFTGVSDFEYTPELIFFDLLHIPLYHGWLVDPNEIETATSIGNLSYNQLVDKIITHKTSTRPELAFEALVVEQFLERTASQLTYHGLSQLNSTLKDGELSVLFRNNHFITLSKSKDQLYQLVTDQGFLTESRVVWETLNNIENDGLFVDGDFIPVPPKLSLTAEDQQVQVDQDYLIALSLQEEQKKDFEKDKEWETFKTENGLNELSDEEFARKLQEEEKRKAGQLTNYQDDGQSSQSDSQPKQLNQSRQNEQLRDNFRSPHSGNKRSQSLPSRKSNNKPDDKSNKCSMM